MKIFNLTLISVFCYLLSSCDADDYKVTVKTGDNKDAGTNGKVYITLLGDKGNSNRILLDKEGKTEFQRGQIDTFYIKTEDIGNVYEIRIALQCTESSDNTDWFLETVSLEDKTHTFFKWFHWNKWLKTTAKQKTVFVEISLSNHSPYTAYKVTVETGNKMNAGTHGKVYITLIGTKGNSPKILLNRKGKFEFQHGQTDTFYIETKDIGIVHKIRIELESIAQSYSPNWFLRGVGLKDIKRQKLEWFHWDEWLTPTEEQETVSIEISSSK